MTTDYLFYFCNGIGSVFDSQILALINAINERKIFKKVYFMLGIEDEVQKKKLKGKKISLEIEVIFYKTYPNYPFYNILQRISISKALKSSNINYKNIIFHTRGELIAWHLSKVLGKEYTQNIMPDIRGASIEEVKEYYKLNYFKKYLKNINYKKAIHNLIKYYKISVVSKSLKNYLEVNFKINPDKIAITPCLSDIYFKLDDSRRNEIRNMLNIGNDEILLVFSSGGTAVWQNCNVIKILAKRGMKVLNLSPNEIIHENIINKFVSYKDMPLYLNASDIGIIWRDESIVNKVSSPVKFSEYICCGLPVIANNSVDMISEYIYSNLCGLVKDKIDDINLSELKKLKQINRYNIAEKGLMNFGIDTIADAYQKTYKAEQLL